MNYYADMFALFDAPALVLLTVDRELSLEYAMLDVGLFLQTFCLLAPRTGLGDLHPGRLGQTIPISPAASSIFRKTSC